MQYRGLRAFCLAAEHRSFKDAANELCLTASAVSHQIRDLESYLDVRLFDRQPRSIALTPAGHQFLAAVAPHMRAIEAAADSFRNRARQQSVTIEMPAFFGSEMFLPRLSEFSDQHRHIDLHIVSRDPDDETSPGADITVALSRHRPNTGKTSALFPIFYQPACSPEVFERWQQYDTNLYAGLEEATLLVHKARPNAWQQWFAATGVEIKRPRQTIVVDSMYALARTAEQSGGVALIPMPVSELWFKKGALVTLFAPTLRSADRYWVTTSEHANNSSSAATLHEWIVNSFAPTGDELSSVA